MKRSTPIALVAFTLALLAYAAWGRPTTAQAATPTATPTPVITQTVIVTDSANLRAGPGTTYKIIGAAKVGQRLTVIGHNPAGTWLQLDTKAWIAAFLVKPATAATPNAAATATPTKPAQAPAPVNTTTPTPPPPTPTAPEPVEGTPVKEKPNVALLILVNHNSEEILAIRNDGNDAVDIGGWWLDGSKGNDTCTVPNGTTLAPGALYQIATGDSVPSGPGFSCGTKPIWNNSNETIYLHMSDGSTISIESVRV